VVGAYANSNSLLQVNIMIFFGLIGYLMRKTGFEPAPLVMAYILCPFLEDAFRQSLIMSYGKFTIFFTRPIPVTILSVTFLLIISNFFAGASKKRKMLAEKFKEDD
jgi:putative tricarboxylic transport membrane protein